MRSHVLRASWRPTGFSISLTTKEFFMEKLPSFAEHCLLVSSAPSLCPFPTCSAPWEAVLCVYISGSIPLLSGFLWDSDRVGTARERLEGERRRIFLILCLQVTVLGDLFFFFLNFQDFIYLCLEGSPGPTFFYFSYLKEAATQFYFWGGSQTRGRGAKPFPRHGPLVTSVCQLTRRLTPPHSFPHFQYSLTYLTLLEIEIALLKPAMVCDPVAGCFQQALNYPLIFIFIIPTGFYYSYDYIFIHN